MKKIFDSFIKRTKWIENVIQLVQLSRWKKENEAKPRYQHLVIIISTPSGLFYPYLQIFKFDVSQRVSFPALPLSAVRFFLPAALFFPVIKLSHCPPMAEKRDHTLPVFAMSPMSSCIGSPSPFFLRAICLVPGWAVWIPVRRVFSRTFPPFEPCIHLGGFLERNQPTQTNSSRGTDNTTSRRTRRLFLWSTWTTHRLLFFFFLFFFLTTLCFLVNRFFLYIFLFCQFISSKTEIHYWNGLMAPTPGAV